MTSHRVFSIWPDHHLVTKRRLYPNGIDGASPNRRFYNIVNNTSAIPQNLGEDEVLKGVYERIYTTF